MEEFDYLAFLARNVSPARLCEVAAQRLVRRATELLSAPEERGDAALLALFCAEDVRDFTLKLSSARASRLWADASRRQALESVALRVPGLFGRAMARAEAAFRREFFAFGRVVSFGRGPSGIDWTLDPLSGRHFSERLEGQSDEDQPPPSGRETARAGVLAGETRPDQELGSEAATALRARFDPKGAWALGRLDQLVALAQGVWLSPEESDRGRFCEELLFQLRDFERKNPPGAGIQWRSPMEVALRAVNLSLAFLMTRHRPEWQRPSAGLALVRLLWTSGRFVEANLESATAVPNNHLVADLVGLLHLGVIFPEFPESRRWRERAAAGLRQEIAAQTLDDGFSFEGSTGYHRLAVELFTLALFAADAGRIDLGDLYRRRLRAMFHATGALLDARGWAPQLGDNDSGRALPLTQRASLDHGYLLPLGAALFGDAELKRAGLGYCDEALFLMGPAGLTRFESLAESLLATSRVLPKAGLAILRAGPLYCAMSCGSTGQAGVGGHGHNDKLGVELRLGDSRLVADPGSPCYTSDPRLRDRYRSTALHATVQLDGEEQNPLPARRPFALPDVSRARIVHFESGPTRDRCVGEHQGYRRLSGSVRHEREIVLDRVHRALRITDRLSGSGRHELALRFPILGGARPCRDLSDGALHRLRKIAQPFEILEDFGIEIGEDGAPLAIAFPPWCAPFTLRAVSLSPGYGELEAGTMLTCVCEVDLPIELTSAVLFLDASKAP